MLSRFFLRSSNLRLVALVTSKSQPRIFSSFIRPLSTNSGGDGSGNGYNRSDDPWKFSQQNEEKFGSVFGEDSGTPSGVPGSDSLAGEDDWLNAKDDGEENVFKSIEKEEAAAKGGDDWLTAEGYKPGSDSLAGGDDWVNAKDDGGENVFKGIEEEEAVAKGGVDCMTAEEHKPWSLKEEVKDDIFDIGDEMAPDFESSVASTEAYDNEQQKLIEREEKELSAILKGPDRAFGDLIAKSGITDEMLDSLIALKDFQGIEGLPPLTEIRDMRYEKSLRKSSRADIELQKQEEMAKSRVRQVDEKGRAYGTGRRKCSIARVWIEPGEGKFLVNEKDFDVYFPMLDHRAALLRPLAETKTLGLWDIKCTVKGGGVSGQVGAIQLGISRALQNWEPDLRPPLRSAGFLTRDSRVVERKKPGKAKARKSFQWVKR
ncbi:PREDICTED: 28S ribosomal protein S9, mitochondrial [Tarenaya hassleriana]|uniref:28S ribosomal protein S9, mitochondrial n=1 Tax=Tarenaya hassleriana TaxID=28532 RepID=UPI00053C294D|nr:PREDICTED: 28S ribosomal protein S9, mitochondrial [Tarenaya hassleriana]